MYVDSQKKLGCLGLLRVHEQAIKAKEDELVCMSIHNGPLSVSACLGVHAQAIKANQEGGLA